jgi:hypothetical protein
MGLGGESAKSCEVGRSQLVVATPGQSLFLEAYEAGFVRGDQINQDKSPVEVLIESCHAGRASWGSSAGSVG